MSSVVCFAHAYTTHFSFSATAATDIYTLSLHDALPIYSPRATHTPVPGSTILLSTWGWVLPTVPVRCSRSVGRTQDRKSTRLNSSHTVSSYAVFCLKKKRTTTVGSEWLSGRTDSRRLRR